MAAKAIATGTRVNGVSTATLSETLAAAEETDCSGKCQFRARSQWLDGGHTRTIVKDFYGAGMEQTSRARPFVLETGGVALFRIGDRAIDPLEHLLAALGASVTSALVWHATVRGIHVDAIDTWVEGDIDLRGCLGLDPNQRAGFGEIRLIVKLDAEASDAQLDELIDLATRYSPDFDTLNHGTCLTVRRDGARLA